MLSASAADGKVAWYENLDGLGTFGHEQAITLAAPGASAVFAADLDGDGDEDVLSASQLDDKVAWYENTDGLGSFGPQRIVSTGADCAQAVHAEDLDGDGDRDVLSASYCDDRLSWYENTNGLGTFGPERVITSGANGARSVLAEDLDGDGDRDVLAAAYVDSDLTWYENVDGLGTFGPRKLISQETDGPWTVFAADLDGDGDRDVLSASVLDDEVAWYENSDALGTFGTQQVITDTALSAKQVTAADLDGDGDRDVVSASSLDDKIAWYENTDGLGSFDSQQIVTASAKGARSVFAADLDGDGDQDVLSASQSDSTIAWYTNVGSPGQFGPLQVITALAFCARSVFAADLDGDGDGDALSASMCDHTIAWYENGDGLGTFGPRQVITNAAVSARAVFAADLDGDGDPDVLSASPSSAGVAWYENTDGLGSFGAPSAVTTGVDGAESVVAVDLDGDGDLDVLKAPSGNGALTWYENVDGLGVFGTLQVIATGGSGAGKAASPADLDGDGDQDVLSASTIDDQVSWYENVDGLGLFGSQQVVTSATHEPRAVLAADLDGDADLDVLSASYVDGKVAWYENSDGGGSFGPQQVITTTAKGAWSVFAAHLDGDGDADVLSASYIDHEVAWYENQLDCNGNGVKDSLDVASGTSPDCNSNGWPDECEITSALGTDCNGNGVPDECDVLAGVLPDCNGNGVADCVDVQGGASTDCDGNGVPDECDVLAGVLPDCNGNGVADCVDVQGGASTDCDGNGVPDECDVLAGVLPDCDGNGVADCVDLVSGTGTDCDGNGILDECDVAAGTLPDCDANGVADCADLSSGEAVDCNANGVPDTCDIAQGGSSDCDLNGVPDECAPPDCIVDLSSLVSSLSLASGGTQPLALTGASAYAGKHYVVLGSLSGTSPGIPTGLVVLPLNLDAYLLWTIQNPNSPLLSNSLDIVNALGFALASFNLPAGSDPALAGATVHHAAAILDLDAGFAGTGDVIAFSNAVPLTLAP